MKIKKLGCIILSFCCFFVLLSNNVQAQEDWQDEYTGTNGKEDFYAYENKERGVYSGYARDGEFLLSDENNIFHATRVRGAYVGGRTVNYYYVPSLGREVDARDYYLHENQNYNPPLTLKLKRECTMYTQPFLFDKYKINRTAVVGEYTVTKRNIYWSQITLDDGTVGWIMPQYSDQNEYLAQNNAYYKETKETLSVDNIHGIGIYQKMMPIKEMGRPGFVQAPKYVTIHNTANTSKGANALAHANLQMNNSRNASWHYTVDQSSIYQSIPMNEVGWHAGDGELTGNSSTVAIEICENSDGNYAKSEHNAALLTARILYENKLSSDAVRLHRDWSGKNCAHNIIEGTKGTMGWGRFKEVVKQEYNRIISVEGPIDNDIDIANGVMYSSHVQGIGWQWNAYNGQMSGTSGMSYRLEAMKLQLINPQYAGSIEYQTHIEGIGWQDWKNDGNVSGTSGKSLRLEAMKIRLSGEIANHYDIYYRVHAQGFGWMDWAKNGESAGTAGYSYRLEAMQIKLVLKGDPAPGEITNAYRESLIGYQTHVQGIGWQDYVFDGQSAGTTGLSYRLEGIILSLFNQKYAGGLQYQTHIEGIGWQNEVNTGQMSGTSGRALRLEAIRIKLTGEMANKYDIYYRVHAQGFGWMGWAKNGDSSGTAGYAYRLEALETVLVPKGGAAPGSTTNTFVEK